MVHQREYYKRDKLSGPLVTRLTEDLGLNLKGEGSPFGFPTKSKDRKRKSISDAQEKLDSWKNRCDELERHLTCEGTLDNLDEETPLGWWANRQRLFFKKGLLGKDRVERLTALGFDSEAKKNRKEVPWNQNFEELKEFKKKHGHTKVCTILQRLSLLAFC